MRTKIEKKHDLNIQEIMLEIQKQKSEYKRLSPEQQRKFSEKKCRRYPPAINILIYWEIKFPQIIDWGEPECFGCRNLTFSLKAEKNIQNSLQKKGYKAYQEWNHFFTRCHLIASCFGGPSQAWNLVYLCDWCHKTMDKNFQGLQKDYDNMVKWIGNRRSYVLNYLHSHIWSKLIYTFPEFNDKNKNNKSLIVLDKIMEIAQSKITKQYLLDLYGYADNPMEGAIKRYDYAISKYKE